MANRQSGTAVTIFFLFVAVWLMGRCSGSDHRTEQAASSRSYAPSQTDRASLTTQAATPQEERFVEASTLNMRESPGGAVIGRLTRGDTIVVEQEQGDWVRVRTSDSRNGWISRRYTCNGYGCWHAREVRAAPVRRSTYTGGTCPCSGSNNCIGPRGGRYCITSGGNKRYR